VNRQESLKARLYVAGRLIAEVDVPLAIGERVPRHPRLNDELTVVLTDEHPHPDQRPLFLRGRLESA